jgi:transcriptional antiterminator RfaH
MNWYCVHTRPLKETQVAKYIQDRLGLETFAPCLKRPKSIRRVIRMCTSPLFPRYLFCRYDLALQHRAVRYAPDVLDVVHFGEAPAVVREPLIAELKSWVNEGVNIIATQPVLRSGDLVEITDGPMRGMRAVILHAPNDRERVTILLSLLEGQAHMTIHRGQLERAV